MLTDWVLIRRLAREIQAPIARRPVGGRRPARRRPRRGALSAAARAAAAGSRSVRVAPVVTIEARRARRSSTRPALGGRCAFAARHAPHGRLLAARRPAAAAELRNALAFGVSDKFDCYVELVPRFGNVVLVKGDPVVAARKEFAPSENPRRARRPAMPYSLPPLPPRTTSARRDRRDRRSRPALRLSPRRALAPSLPDAALRASTTPSRPANRRCSRFSPSCAVSSWRPPATSGAAGARGRSASVWTSANASCAKSWAASLASVNAPLSRELCATRASRSTRRCTTSPSRERDAAKERAGKLFAEYKKLGKSLPHLDEREREAGAMLEAVEMLRWELERARDEDIEEVESCGRAALTARSGTRRRSATETQAHAARDAHAGRVAHRRRTLAGGERRAYLSAGSPQRSVVSRARRPGRARYPHARRPLRSARRGPRDGGGLRRFLFSRPRPATRSRWTIRRASTSASARTPRRAWSGTRRRRRSSRGRGRWNGLRSREAR